MKTNLSWTHHYNRKLIGSTVPPPARPRFSDVTQGVVGGAHAFVLRISSFFGLAPLRFESRTNGFAVTLSDGMCIYSYLLITILVLITVVGLVSEINVGMELSMRMNSRMSQVVSSCDILVVVVVAGVGVYGASRRMRKMLKFLESVASVDKNIGAQYSVVKERKLCGVLLAILIFFSILITDDFYFHATQVKKFNRQWDVVKNYIGFYILWMMALILELQFAFTAHSVRMRFQAMNDVLALTVKHVSVPQVKQNEPRPINTFINHVAPAQSQQTANIDNLCMDSLPKKDHALIVRKCNSGEPHLIVPPCEAIRQLTSYHGTLSEVIHHINDSYGLPLIAILMSIFLHLIITPYYLIMEIILSTNRVHFYVLLSLWCVLHMLRMFIIVEPCHLTIIENKRTEELVCSLMSYTPSTGELSSRLQLFSRHLMLRSAAYSPLGMCILDRTLVASVIGSVTTYLVILIQFQ